MRIYFNLFLILHSKMVFYDYQIYVSKSLLINVSCFSINRSAQRQISHLKKSYLFLHGIGR